MTNSLKKRFVKDNNLNINVFDEPYFTQRLIQFSKLPKFEDILTKFDNFSSMITHDFDSEEHFFSRMKKLQGNVIEDIKTAPGYEEYNTIKIETENHHFKQIKNESIYIQPNIGKKFVSIDLVKANFQVLKNSFLLADYSTNTYYDLVQRSFEEHYSDRFKDYIIGSKYFRQVIFGNTNPKRQQSIQKHMINSIITVLREEGFEYEDFVSKTPDEVLLEGDIVGFSDDKDIKLQIEFINGSFGWIGYKGKPYQDFVSLGQIRKDDLALLLVIGNIYENPELLADLNSKF